MTYKEFISRQSRCRRLAKEKSESMKYYEEHKEEIEAGRKATLIIASLSRIDYVFHYISVEDILCKVSSLEELNFYYKWLCEVR